MKEIAAAISDGAQAFLTAEYKILIIFVAVLFILIGVGIGNWITAVCFVVGALFSTLAGYCGMKVATKACLLYTSIPPYCICTESGQHRRD